MTKAIGGYVRRKDRRYVPSGLHLNPGAHLGRLRHAVAGTSGAVITWHDELAPPQIMPPPPRFESFEAAAGEFLHNLLSPVSTPGPPYTHTFVPPEPIGEDEDGNDIYPEPGPAMTLTEARDYVAEVTGRRAEAVAEPG